MPNRFLTICIAISALLSSAGVVRAAEAYIVIDARTGYILQAQEARQKRQVGSLTKIVTAAVVLDWSEHKRGDLNQIATVPAEAFADISENAVGFQPGDQVSLRDLLYAALVQSDNVAAYTLAHAVGSQLNGIVATSSRVTPVDVFVGQMNALAKQLKMERSRFVNPHGSDYKVRPMPYSTAEDIARITRYAMNKASFRFYVSQRERQISFSRGGRKMNYVLRNTNQLLGQNGIDGVKTGMTARAGECLVLTSERQPEVVHRGQMTTVFPRRLIVVVLGSPNRFGEGAQLLAGGWQRYDQWAAAGRTADPDRLL
ncbi:MAG TPA: serine hydrolase [Chthoniobacterales bacterium]|nr:serine hydrolase [Chthoniobacterales bacterium]